MSFRAVLLCTLVGCSSGGESTGLTADQIAIVDCTRLTISDVVRIVAQVERILTDDVTLTPVSGTTYSYEFDFDDSTIDGQVVFPNDPANGIPLDEDVVLTFGLTGPLQGSGNATFRFVNATRATMRGGMTLSNDLGCSSSLIFLPALPLNVVFSRPIAGAAPAAQIVGYTLWGPMSATISAFERDRFAGDVDIAQGMQDTLISGEINDSAFRHVFALFPDAIQLARLGECVTAIGELRTELFGILLGLTRSIDAAGADLTTLPAIPGLTLTPVSSSNASYSVDLTQLGTLLTAGTIRGSVRLTRVNFETRAFWSWRIQGEIGEETIVGQSARFYEVAVAQGGGVSSTGEGSLGRLDCVGYFNEEDQRTVRGTVGAHSLALDFANDIPVAARVDGIPVPLESVVPR
jgi:hypothetical protein